MATENIIRVSDDLLAQLQLAAATEGKTVDALADEALRKGLEERSWHDLLEYGRERGRASGFAEEQSADVVHSWRNKQRDR